MTVVQLPDETLPAFPDRPLSTFYSTKPFDIAGFLKEIGGLDAVIVRGVGGSMEPRQLTPDECVSIGDVVLVNPNSRLQCELKAEDRSRQNYVVTGQLPTGYKIRQLPVSLFFSSDIPELRR